jgi:hypothetical protein
MYMDNNQGNLSDWLYSGSQHIKAYYTNTYYTSNTI